MVLFLIILITIPSVSALPVFDKTITANNTNFKTSRWTFTINITEIDTSISDGIDTVIFQLQNISATEDNQLGVFTNYTSSNISDAGNQLNTSSNYTYTFDANLTAFWPGRGFGMRVWALNTTGSWNWSDFNFTVDAINSSDLETWMLNNDLSTNNVTAYDFEYANSTDDATGFDIVNDTTDTYAMHLTLNDPTGHIMSVGGWNNIDMSEDGVFQINTSELSFDGITEDSTNNNVFLNLLGFIPTSNISWARLNTSGTWSKHYYVTGSSSAPVYTEITTECNGENLIEAGSQTLTNTDRCKLTDSSGNEILYTGTLSGFLVQKGASGGDIGVSGGGGFAPRKRTAAAPIGVAPQALPSLPSVEGVSNTLSKIPVIGNTLSNWYDRIVGWFKS